MNRTAFLVGIVAVVIVSASARADMASLCAAVPICVYDANNVVLGFPNATSTNAGKFFRQINGKWYQGRFQRQNLGLLDDQVFFSGPNCTGTRNVIDFDIEPQAVHYDESTQKFFAATSFGGFDWQSVKLAGNCTSWGTNCLGSGNPCHAQNGGP